MREVRITTVPEYGSSGFIETEDGKRWPWLKLGEHTCVLPIHSDRQMIWVGLLQEHKGVLDTLRTKVPSDFRRGLPDDEGTARKILFEKTGISDDKISCLVRFDMLVPGWPINITFDNTTRWFAWVTERCGQNLIWLDMEEVYEILKRMDTPIIDAPTSHLLHWIQMLFKHGELIPGEQL